MKKHLLVALVGIAFAASAIADIQDPPGNDYGPTRKLGRGIGNFLFASCELPVTVCKINKEEGNAAAASYGVVRGLGRSTARHFTGLRSEEHTSELQSLRHLVCRLLLEKKKIRSQNTSPPPQ